jgi:TRAP-type C4-dicarboxylate transport system permease small subunit
MLASPRRDMPRALRLLGLLIDTVLVLLCAVMGLLVFFNVLSRFIFNLDVAWSGELVTFCLVWGSFLGGTAAVQRGAHMRVGEVIEALPIRARLVLEALVLVATLALLIFVAWYGLAICQRTWEQETTVLYWPQGLLYAGMPVAAVLAIPFVVHDLLVLLRGRLPDWSDA